MTDEHQKHSSLFELAAILGQQTDFQEMLRLVTLKAADLVAAEIVSIVMVNPKTQRTVKTVVKENQAGAAKRFDLIHSNVIGWAMKHEQDFLSPDLLHDSRFSEDAFADGDAEVGSVMCLSMQSEGRTIGYLLLMNGRGQGQFGETDLDLLKNLAAISAPFLSNTQKIQEYFSAPLPQAALVSKYEPLGLLGKSAAFIELLQATDAAARCDVRVLLEGPSGTGKELIARAIHQLSARNNQPFIAIDCGALPDTLLESELFGHVKGAFTGAAQERKGLMEEADGGTLFMDEITNLPFDMQAKLLRVLQEGEIRKIGSNRPQKVDVRIISASSAPLRTFVDKDQFREDLYYRLHVYPIHVPALNERREDIPLLADVFLKRVARQQQKQAEAFNPALLAFMRQRTWEGNIRELENFVERLVTLTPVETQTLTPKLLPREFQKELQKLTPKPDAHPIQTSLQQSLQEHEKRLLQKALMQTDGNQSAAARLLKISERTMRYKMQKLGLSKSDANTD